MAVKILIVHNRYRSVAPSGEDNVVDTEAGALALAGHTVVRFERHSDDIGSWSLLRRASLPGRVIWSRKSQRELSEVLRSSRPDVVHIHNTFPLISPSVLQACAAERVPAVVTIHNYKLACARGEFFRDGQVCHDCAHGVGLPALAHGCYRDSRAATVPVVIGTATNRKAWQTLPSAYIFVSESQRHALSPVGLPRDRSFVKWNLVPRESPTARRPQNRVVYLGRLDEAKGIRVLVAAWDHLRAGGRAGALGLAIAGGGPLEPEIRAWSSDKPEVEFLGLLAPDACAEVLATARAAILPSAWEETFGLVVVEAFGSGVPVVAADHGALAELVTDGVTGAHFRPGDSDDLARVLGQVAADPEGWGRARPQGPIHLRGQVRSGLQPAAAAGGVPLRHRQSQKVRSPLPQCWLRIAVACGTVRAGRAVTGPIETWRRLPPRPYRRHGSR